MGLALSSDFLPVPHPWKINPKCHPTSDWIVVSITEREKQSIGIVSMQCDRSLMLTVSLTWVGGISKASPGVSVKAFPERINEEGAPAFNEDSNILYVWEQDGKNRRKKKLASMVCYPFPLRFCEVGSCLVHTLSWVEVPLWCPALLWAQGNWVGLKPRSQSKFSSLRFGWHVQRVFLTHLLCIGQSEYGIILSSCSFQVLLQL